MNTRNNFHMYDITGSSIPVYTMLHDGSLKKELVPMKHEVVNNDTTIGHYGLDNHFYSNKEQTKLMRAYYGELPISSDHPF